MAVCQRSLVPGRRRFDWRPLFAAFFVVAVAVGVHAGCGLPAAEGFVVLRGPAYSSPVATSGGANGSAGLAFGDTVAGHPLLAARALLATVAASALLSGPRRSFSSSRSQQGSAFALGRAAKILRCANEPTTPSDSTPTPSSASDDALAEAKAAAELARLELEAAKLRAEAKQLEESVAVERRKARAERIIGPDAKSIDLDTLRTRLKDVEGFECSQEQALKLAAICGTGPDGNVSLRMGDDGTFSLTLEDLMSEGFNTELDRLIAESRAAKQQAEVEEREKQIKLQQEERARNPEPEAASYDPGEINDDRSVGSRILGCLAYLLPLSDALQFIAPLVSDYPALAVLLSPIALVSALVNAIPFGSFIILVGFIFAAQYKDFPRLVRFNLEQAVLLTIASFLPSLIILGVGVSGGMGVVAPLGGLAFLLELAIVVYCWSTTASGEVPDGVPIISDTTRNVVDRGTFGR